MSSWQLKLAITGAREMDGSGLRVPDALPEEPSLVPNTHIRQFTTMGTPGDSKPSSGLQSTACKWGI